ncbi:MAG: hypothetical protein ACREJB_04720 [Planctomycetaceae bacterium]
MTIACVALLVAYVFSMSPLYWLGIRLGVSMYTMIGYSRMLYFPVYLLWEHTPLEPVLTWWHNLWADLLLS